MRKLVLFGLLLSLSAGCGRGWLPMCNRGASCNGGCLGSAPALPPAGCVGCAGNAAGYGGYEGEMTGYGGDIINSYDGAYGSGVPGVITSPPMSSLPKS